MQESSVEFANYSPADEATANRAAMDGEQQRLEALRRYAILDSLPEQCYNDLTKLASFICGTPISTVTLIDEKRQWFKAALGLTASETPRSQSICAHTLIDSQTLIVEDATIDSRFQDYACVLGEPNIRFYAGAPIIEKTGHVLGTVCVIDTVPRVLSATQVSALEALARQAMALLEKRKTTANLNEATTAFQLGEKLLKDSNWQLQTFVDSLPALAWVANADGWITWYNRRWYEYTGRTPEAMEGWGWQSVHDPAVLPLVMERWTQSISTQQSFEMVFPLRAADGALRSFMTRVVPLRDEAGTVVQWFGTNTEIDELERTQRALEETAAGLKQVMTATSDAVVSVNREWLLTYLNPVAEHLYGSIDKLVGRNIWDAFSETPYNVSPFVEHFHRAMDLGIAGSFEAEYGDPPNTLGVEVYPSKYGIVVFSRDITKLKQATAAALQNEKLAAVGRLASSIAHEINNPLEAVTNLLYLARGTSEPAVLDEYLESAERELRRVSVIANQTLQFYKQTTKPSPVHCGNLYKETLSLYQGRLTNANVKVVMRLRASRPAICFEGEIRQVLSNLIGNAIDAMQTCGGCLYLRSRDAICWKTGQQGLTLSVADTGSGMPAHVRERIFDAFFSTKGIGGTGLGLWVSKGIADRHHGSLRVRSSGRHSSHGSIFLLFLPFDLLPLDSVSA